MKTRSYNKAAFVILSLMVIALVMLSCEDDGASDGTPMITRVYQLDTVARHKDSTFVAAEPFVLLVISGQNIGGVTHAYFNDFETSFNTNYNTNTELIIRVPSEAPTDATASNQIRLVTSHGEATYDFKIIAKATVASVDKMNFGVGRGDITLRGKNFADMERIVAYREKDFPAEIVEDSVVCEIISKTADKLVVRIPENTISRVVLNMTNSSGTSTTSQVFVNADVALTFFTEDFGAISTPDGDGKWTGDSWDKPFAITSDQAFAGTKSLAMTLEPGGWKWFGFTSWWPRFYYYPDYKYITFAIKGGDVDMDLWISCSTSKVGNYEFSDKNKFVVAAKIWNYYKLEISSLDLLYNESIIQQLGFRTQGPPAAKQLYFDDVMVIK